MLCTCILLKSTIVIQTNPKPKVSFKFDPVKEALIGLNNFIIKNPDASFIGIKSRLDIPELFPYFI